MPFVLAQSVIILLALLLIGWWFIQGQKQRKQQQQLQNNRELQVHEIIERGGPHSLEEYFVIFPDACPQCGGRTRLEGIGLVPEPILEAPLTTMSQPRRPAWICVRCEYGTAPKLAQLPPPVQRRITSPFLEPQLADAIPEPPQQEAVLSPTPSQNIAVSHIPDEVPCAAPIKLGNLL